MVCETVLSPLLKVKDNLVHFCSLFLLPETRHVTFSIILGIFFLHTVIKYEQIRENGCFQDLEIPVEDTFASFGPKNVESFPDHGDYRIPKVIHQIARGREVARRFVPWIRSWQKYHKDWEFFLWTPTSSRAFIQDRFAHLVSLYDRVEVLHKEQLTKYLVLYSYGGVFIDMDVESLRPLDPIVRKYSCFIGQEPLEHPILEGRFSKLIVNALIGCRSHHPFILMLIDNFKSLQEESWFSFKDTGSKFVTLTFNNYTRYANNESTLHNGVYLAPPEYFYPSIDPSMFFLFRHLCYQFQQLDLTRQKACKSLKLNGGKRQPANFSFTVYHRYKAQGTFLFHIKGPIDFYNIVPQVKSYDPLSKISLKTL